MNEVIDKFHAAIELFEKETASSVSISDAALGVFHTGRQNRALFVFSKLIAHAMAIQALLFNFRIAEISSRLLDHFSIAVLGRSIIDAALMTMYISSPAVSADEWNLRRHVLWLHDLSNRKRFMLSIEKSSGHRDNQFLSSYEVVKSGLLQKIEDLCIAKQLPKETIDTLKKGQTVFIGGSRGAAREAGWDVDEFDFHQAYLSNWVHSHPVSFMRADDHGISFSEPSEYQYNFVTLILQTCAKLMATTNSRMKTFSGSQDLDHLGQMD